MPVACSSSSSSWPLFIYHFFRFLDEVCNYYTGWVHNKEWGCTEHTEARAGRPMSAGPSCSPDTLKHTHYSREERRRRKLRDCRRACVWEWKSVRERERGVGAVLLRETPQTRLNWVKVPTTPATLVTWGSALLSMRATLCAGGKTNNTSERQRITFSSSG